MTIVKSTVPFIALVALFGVIQGANAHGVHPTCMWGPMTPNGQGPDHFHRTPEAGVHIACRRPPEGPKNLQFKPRQQEGLSTANKLVIQQ